MSNTSITSSGATVIHALATEAKTAPKATPKATPKASGKTAAKTASKAIPKTPGKTAPKAAPKTAAKNAGATGSIKYAIVDYARPKAGHALFAHTAAFLKLSGMDEGKAYPSSKARSIIGATAVKYHSGNGNLAATDKGLTLTPKGRAFFAARGEANPELLAAFIGVMTTGKPDDKANVKSESSRVTI